MSELDARLARVAQRQRMLVTLDDVRAAGGSEDHAYARVRGGRWTRVDRGVFHFAGATFDWETRLLATILAAGPGAVASHLAAARLFGLPGYAEALPEVSIPRGRRYRRAGIRVHESTDLERSRTLVHAGIPVTGPARTTIDLARYVGDQRLARTVEAARRLNLVSWSDLITELATLARKGRPGVQRLRRIILANAHRTEITDSDFELLMIGLITGSGLAEPVLHHRIHDTDGRFVAEVDLAYPDLKIAIECDGAIHRDPEVHERDLARQNDLMLEGWTVLRFTYERLRRRPDLVVAEIRAAMQVARARQ